MKDRILTVLHALAIADTSNNTNNYRRLIFEAFPTWSEADLQEKASAIYRRILHDYSHFTITTIDGFSQKVIRSFTYELHLDAAYKIEMNTNKVKQELTIMLNELLDQRPDLLEWIIEFAEKKIANNENWNYRRQLTDLASQIFTENFQEFDKYLQIYDSDGLFNLLNKEIEAYLKDYRIRLAVAIQKFKEAYVSLNIDPKELKGKSRNPLVAASKVSFNTGKLYAVEIEKIFERYNKLIDERSPFLYNDDAFTAQDGTVLEHIKQGVYPSVRLIINLLDEFSQFISYEAIHNNLYYLRLLKEMSDLLSIWRKENSAQLISDSQILLNKLGLDENSDPTFIWEKIGNRYRYFLFDEFQDTSRIQWKNYSPLLLNALATPSGEHHEHLIVGDVKQSIYRWRNGDWRILLQQVEEQISDTFHLRDKASLKQFVDSGSLEVNYRSLPQIIEFNNYVFSQTPTYIQNILNQKVLESLDDKGKTWWEASGNSRMLIKAYENSVQQIPEFRAAHPERKGSIEIKYFEVESNLHRTSQVKEVSTKHLVDTISEWMASGRYRPEQIGILVRTNAEAQIVIQQLMQHRHETGIQFEVISGDALLLVNNDAVQLLIETLKALVYDSPEYVLYKTKMVYLYHLIHSDEKLNDEIWLKFHHNKIQELRYYLPDPIIDSWYAWHKLPLIYLVERLIEAYSLHTDGSPHLPYILAFKEMVNNFSLHGERGINQFLAFWEEDGKQAVLPSSNKVKAIEVSTIHKSKGLAYDVVLIPFCSWSLDARPGNNFWMETEDSAFADFGKLPVKYNSILGKSAFYRQYFEEMLFNYMDALNTFYVATTRAVQHLYISAPSFKVKDNKKRAPIDSVPSSLISDILYAVLKLVESPFPMVENGHLSENILANNAEPPLFNETSWSLNNYPLSGMFEKTIEQSTTRDFQHLATLDEAIRYGILAHEIISKIEKERDIQPILQQYIQDGLATEEQSIKIQREIEQIWSHPDMRTWFTGDYKVWSEADIIMPNGQTVRPDKVFSNGEETIVLDFKFSQTDYIGHKAQVDKYINALKSLGLQKVKGYLFYAKSNALVQI